MNLCQISGRALNFIYDYYKYVNLDKTVNITSFSKNCIVLDKRLNVYAFKLEGYSNYQKTLSNLEQIRSSYMFSEDFSRIMITYVKTDTYQGSYLFCTNEDIALSIKESMNLEMLSSMGIINALFDSYLINDYYVSTDKRLTSSIALGIDRLYLKEEVDIDVDKPLIPIEMDVLYFKGKEIMKEAVAHIEKDFTVFQSFKFSPKESTVFSNIYRVPWEGAIYMYIDLSYDIAHAKAKQLKLSTRDEGGQANEYATRLFDLVDSKDIDVCLANCVMVLKNSKDRPDISAALGVEFIEKHIGVREILAKTLLLKRDADFSSLVMTKHLQKYFAVVHKKDATREIENKKIEVDFYGKDINGAFVNYVFRENTNPHTIVIAGSGSGKSFSIQKIISQIIGFCAKTLISKNLFKKQIRYFDVGFSAQNFIRAIRINHGDLVDEISPSLDDMRFNLVDIEKITSESTMMGAISEDDLSFKMSIFDLALESNRTDRMGAEELAEIKSAIRDLYSNKIYKNLSLAELKSDGFVKVYDTLIEKGYKQYSTLDDIKEEDEYIVNKFKKPTLPEVYTFLQTRSQNKSLSEVVIKTIQTAMQKVKAIDSLGTFSKHPLFEFGKNNFVYFDVNNIKGDPRVFAPIYMYILMSYYNNDMKQALNIRFKTKKEKFDTIPQSYYIIEEAHNFMRYESFKVTFEILAREARKYGVHMIFISQQMLDIPKSIISSIATRIYMAEEEKKDENINAIRDHVGLSKEVEWTFRQTLPYQMLVHYDKGVFGCKFDISKEETALFTSSAV